MNYIKISIIISIIIIMFITTIITQMCLINYDYNYHYPNPVAIITRPCLQHTVTVLRSLQNNTLQIGIILKYVYEMISRNYSYFTACSAE